MPSGRQISSVRMIVNSVLIAAGTSETFSELYSHANSEGLRLGTPITRM